jgi:hypothetical protein
MKISAQLYLQRRGLAPRDRAGRCRDLRRHDQQHDPCRDRRRRAPALAAFPRPEAADPPQSSTLRKKDNLLEFIRILIVSIQIFQELKFRTFRVCRPCTVPQNYKNCSEAIARGGATPKLFSWDLRIGHETHCFGSGSDSIRSVDPDTGGQKWPTRIEKS